MNREKLRALLQTHCDQRIATAIEREKSAASGGEKSKLPLAVPAWSELDSAWRCGATRSHDSIASSRLRAIPAAGTAQRRSVETTTSRPSGEPSRSVASFMGGDDIDALSAFAAILPMRRIDTADASKRRICTAHRADSRLGCPLP